MTENASSMRKAFGTIEFGIWLANFWLIAFSTGLPQGKTT
jgi:hypothetical protein